MMNTAVAFWSMADVSDRLREIIRARGIKQSWLASEAELPPETLSRILTRTTENPGIYTLQKIARALGETIGSLLGETGFDLTAADQSEVRRFVSWAELKLLKSAPPKLEPSQNAIRITLVEEQPAGKVSRRRARVASFDPKRVAPRLRAAASPDREIDQDPEAPEREIPSHYYELGAREVYKADGDSMIAAGITDHDLLFVRPESDAKAAAERIVVCTVGSSTYVKRLRLSSGKIELVSENDRYAPMIVDEDAESFRLVGVVVGRSGYPLE